MARYRGLVYETIFALLYGLGLRVGEVVRLKLADADFSRESEPAEDAIALVALSLTGKERACTLLSQIGEHL